jgi:predicted glycoside hydrolase/deacetylase ChbG (UPF0249 family)
VQANPKPVIINADDFAYSEATSRAIAQLASLGRISATSAMVLSPRWPGDSALLQTSRGRIDVGLHLDWTSPFAVVAGHGMSLEAAMLRSLTGGFEREQVTGAIERQLDAFEAQWKAATSTCSSFPAFACLCLTCSIGATVKAWDLTCAFRARWGREWVSRAG